MFNVTIEHVGLDIESSQTLVMTFWEPLIDILYQNSAYELEILPGIVNGKQLCKLPSSGASWSFNTCKSTIHEYSTNIPRRFKLKQKEKCQGMLSNKLMYFKYA